MTTEHMTDKEKLKRNELYIILQEVISQYTDSLIPRGEINKDISAVFDSLGYNDVGKEEEQSYK